ncbi:MAG: TonB C-terminal domain-containing protein [Polyangiaceae bacterium]|nr:TonB C-terminal domain-containing protein [Polyangiaceae bacterium]
MSRHESTVPIALWLCAAAVVHYASYQGAGAAAEVGIGRLDLRTFVATVAGTVGGGPGDALEVTFQPVEARPSEPEPEPPKPDADPSADPSAAPDPSIKPDEKRERQKPKAPQKQAEKEPEPPKAPEPKKDPPKLTLPPVAATPPPPPPPPADQKRVSVEQHVEDKTQKPNPTAEFQGEHANHVKEQTQARITNLEVNDPDTRPAAAKPSSAAGKEPGDSDKHKVADASDAEGTKRAPGEASSKDHASLATTPGKAATAAQPAAKGALPTADKAGEDGKAGPKVAREAPRSAPPIPAAEAKAPPPSPDGASSDKGTYSVSPFAKAEAKPAGSAQAATAGRAGSEVKSDKLYTIPKWGGGAGPDGTRFNLTPGGALAAIGEGTVKRERAADGERRRSAHRGPWKPSGLDRIKQQIENYVATVKLGNTTALNTAAVPFARYLHHVHNRLHPLFADEFLDSLDSLPTDHALNQPHLRTVLEVALDKDDGRIMKMGITRTSGVTAFDIAALDAMDRAGPFGKPPEAILSPDGRVYLHWEFHRKREVACMTANARPYILASPPDPGGAPKPLPGPRVPDGPHEKGAPPPSREGKKDGGRSDHAPG